jgi:hypothetical protein
MAMTSVLEGPPREAIEATPEDARLAAEDALERTGLTADELISQAASGSFSTLHARMAWVAVGDVLVAERTRR